MNLKIHIEKTKKGYNLKAYKKGVRKLIGTLDLLDHENKNLYLLTGLGVKHKNKGLGSILVRIAQGISKTNQKAIMLRAVPTKPKNKFRLEMFYKKLGFRTVKGEWMVW